VFFPLLALKNVTMYFHSRYISHKRELNQYNYRERTDVLELLIMIQLTGDTEAVAITTGYMP